jgi:hypothetical protein
MEVSMRPSPNDIAEMIALINAGPDKEFRWLFPDIPEPANAFWWCRLYDPEGHALSVDGVGYTPEQAMAYAWIHAIVEEPFLGEVDLSVVVPHIVPDGWRFELTPPKGDAPVPAFT